MRQAAAAGSGIRDVARMAGVAPSTVSRVLNDKLGGVRISAATIERIQQAAATLHYQPNAAARSLRTTRTKTIGVIARNLLHPFQAELLRVIYTTCRGRGYHLLLGHTEHSSTEGGVLGDILSADRVDGVLLIGDILPSATRQEDMERLIASHGQVVTVGGRPSVAGELSILVDDALGIALALEHLMALGHRSIGYITQYSGPEAWEDEQRRLAYRRVLDAHGLPSVPPVEVTVPNGLESIQGALRTLAALPDPPTAVLVNNDVTALTILKAALTGGLRVPDDLSVVGFDDIPFAALTTPGLTTVHQPVEDMGRHAARALLDRIAGKAVAGQPALGTADNTNTIFFPPTLVRRESASAIAGRESSPTGGAHVP